MGHPLLDIFGRHRLQPDHRRLLTHLVHANTGTGIEATRAHVRSTALDWDLPLLEHVPPAGEGYFDLVLGKVTARSRETGEEVRSWPGGFPGPAARTDAAAPQRTLPRAGSSSCRDLGFTRCSGGVHRRPPAIRIPPARCGAAPRTQGHRGVELTHRCLA